MQREFKSTNPNLFFKREFAGLISNLQELQKKLNEGEFSHTIN